MSFLTTKALNFKFIKYDKKENGIQEYEEIFIVR